MIIPSTHIIKTQSAGAVEYPTAALQRGNTPHHNECADMTLNNLI